MFFSSSSSVTPPSTSHRRQRQEAKRVQKNKANVGHVKIKAQRGRRQSSPRRGGGRGSESGIISKMTIDDADDGKASSSSGSKTDKNPSSSTKKQSSFFEEIEALMKQDQNSSTAKSKQFPMNNNTPLYSLLDDAVAADDDFDFAEDSRSSTIFDRQNRKSLANGTTFIMETDNPSTPRSSSSSSSLFDTAPSTLPDDRRHNYYPPNHFRSYLRTLRDDILPSRRFRRNKKDTAADIEKVSEWLLLPHPTVPTDLPSLTSSSPGDDEVTSSATRFRDELKRQRESFFRETELTREQMTIALRALQVLGDFCAKQSHAAPLAIAWEKVKESGLVLREASVSTYLYVVGHPGAILSSGGDLSSSLGFEGGGKSLLDLMTGVEEEERGDDDDDDDDDGGVDVPGEVATYHDLLYEPTEKSVSLRVKALCAKGRATEAERLLDTLPNTSGDAESLRLRTYLPVLKTYCERHDTNDAIKLYHRMLNSPGVIMEPETFVMLLSSLAEAGHFHPNPSKVKPLPAAAELNYPPPSPRLFDALVTDMSHHILEITSASARRLRNAFYKGFRSDDKYNSLEPLPPLANLTQNNTPRASTDEFVVDRVSIDTTSGVCPRTNVTLRLILLTNDEKKTLHDGLLKVATQQYHAFTEEHLNRAINNNIVANHSSSSPYSINNETAEHAEKELLKFANWLDTRNDPNDEPFTAIVDGANVAYFGQNFDQGKFNYHQINFLVKTLQERNENPLVVIPHKYTQKTFFSNTGVIARKQTLSSSDQQILQEWNETGRVYNVPARCLDDYYWMLASVSNQTAVRRDTDLNVGVDDVNERWPGTRPVLITNDLMRDHKMELLAPQLFRRWFSGHIVNYDFAAFVGEERPDGDNDGEDAGAAMEVVFRPADFFSREIQLNDGVWHFPVRDWEGGERFCVGIPRSYDGPEEEGKRE
eukprot:CAMPEP_0172489592 /NCGR_PEP_ID=MMETSP1066-20121228/19702_1 /TAXON_ID=671091 /ORGANISM="Coscinodiscus wailesii, Strain CCMP2513" /LENGTH=932 /DNA_ID=CAMNT_0013257569 /DNA_START=581 /DNA_END=3379 /DNA_ORIENTATION=+